MRRYEHIQAIAELIIAAAFWGFGFIAVVWTLKGLNFAELTWLRFALAGLVGLPFLWKAPVGELKEIFRLSFWPAVLLMGTLIFQSWGLNYTTATKSGFITTLYVVFVPLLESFIMKHRLPWTLWACVVLALVGTILFVDVSLSQVNIGDVLTLICAFFASGQIYILSEVSPKVSRPFVFNVTQSLWGALLLVPLVINSSYWSEPQKVLSWPPEVYWGIASLAFGSTVLAFYLQVRAQSKLSPTISSLLFLLESPFAMIFSITLLGETLNWREAGGAAMIFMSAVGASMIDLEG